MNRLIETIEMKQGKRQFLSFDYILELIKSLACSQGFYGRLYNQIMELDEMSLNDLKEEWENRFKDDLDFILYIEG